MSALDSVEALVRVLGESALDVQGEWAILGRFTAFHDEDSDLICFLMLNADDDAAVQRIPEHPALFRFALDFAHVAADIALPAYVLEDGALEAVLAAEVDADYARAAHRAGVHDAWLIIEGWENGIPLDFLSAAGGAV